jgi:hypothetical protein
MSKIMNPKEMAEKFLRYREGSTKEQAQSQPKHNGINGTHGKISKETEIDTGPRITREALRAQFSISKRIPATCKIAPEVESPSPHQLRARKSAETKKIIKAEKEKRKPAAAITPITLSADLSLPEPSPILPTKKDDHFITCLKQAFAEHVELLQTAASAVGELAVASMICDVNEDYRIIQLLVNNKEEFDRLLAEKEHAYKALHSQLTDIRLVPFIPTKGLFSTASSLAERLKL